MDKPVNIEFSREQLATLGQALGELPYKIAAPLINHINAQIQKHHDVAVDAREEN